MLAELKHKKLGSATLVETLVALLILMISFSCGMAIYQKLLDAGMSETALGHSDRMQLIADSLEAVEAQRDVVLKFREGSYEVRYVASPQYAGTVLMRVVCVDDAGRQLAVLNRFIKMRGI